MQSNSTWDVTCTNTSLIRREAWARSANLFQNPQYSDLTIICRDKAFPAHRNIVCQMSTYFARMCNGNFKEAGTRIIQFDDREPLLVEKMLECLYKGDYKYETLVAVLSYKRPFHASENTDAASISETPSTDYQTTPSEACLTPGSSTEPESDVRPRTAWSSPARFHASMYAYANYFGIELLKARAKQHFNQTFLDQYFSSQFEDTIHEVYAPTPEHDRGLRDIVVNMTMMSLQTLRTLPRRILDDETLKHCPKFTLDLCIALADSRTKPLLAHNSPSPKHQKSF
ncbi:hypothetical protein BDV29DRAFT_192030 [Aspergillus leporis]|uniref:BTB domain-containing protein n=1 Tax=Aspergillus leporis TaxID=41062 RepID=A0A5N5WWZ9_9EURO|nr:hypothetical protein BDV29DRAFT_192030 [Aspergillus leporis]